MVWTRFMAGGVIFTWFGREYVGYVGREYAVKNVEVDSVGTNDAIKAIDTTIKAS